MSPNTKNKIGFLKSGSILVLIAVLAFPQSGQAASVKESVRRGNRLYGQGQFADSLKMYQDALKKGSESDIVNFNAGTALYKQRQYDEAVEHFQKAILSDDISLRERAYYNLGDSFYKSGIGKENADINAAMTALQESLKHLASALALDKKDEDAQYNYDFVNKELERLRKEQQKQQQQPRQNQNGQKDQEEQQNQPQSGAQQSGKEENSPQSKSGEAQEQKRENKEQSPGESSSADESQEQAASGEKSPGEPQGTDEQGQQQGPAQPGGTASGQELTKSEAQRLLQNYQQTEEPRGLLHVFQEKHDAGTVIKDW